MRLSAADIRQQQFGVKLIRGFDPQEVDAFVEEVADHVDELEKENNLLKEQLTAYEERTRNVEERERTLHETLVTTQKIAEEFKEGARREAELGLREGQLRAESILHEAQLQAEKLLEEARQQKTKLAGEIASLKLERRQLAEELLAVIGMHKRLVEQQLAESSGS
jgi:cell division initiation protein